MSEGRLTTELVGFREWEVNANFDLVSLYTPYIWERGVNEAVCIHAPIMLRFGQVPHTAPAHDCDCGLYAWHHCGAQEVPGQGSILGIIQAWGDTEVHYAGFRAQYARVVALGLYKGYWAGKGLRRIAHRYNVPLVPMNELEDVATEFGQHVPKRLVPDPALEGTVKLHPMVRVTLLLTKPGEEEEQ